MNRQPNLVSFIGEPGTGKSSLIEKLQDEMLDYYRVATISSSDLVRQILTPEDMTAMREGGLFPREPELRELMYSMIDDLAAFGAEVILIDGFPRFRDQLVWMRQALYDYPIQMVRVIAPDAVMIQRATARNRDEFDKPDKFQARVAKQRAMISDMEQLISQYGLPYMSVLNDCDFGGPLKHLRHYINWPELKEKKVRR